MKTLWVCLLLPMTVYAQAEPDRASVERLFQEGERAARDERWVAARHAFEEAYAMMPRPAILLNLAIAQSQTEQLCEAHDSFRRFLDDPTITPELREQAERALDELEPQIPHLRVQAQGLIEGDRVLVDGEEQSDLDRLPVNPGPHRISIERGGASVADAQIEVERGGDAVAHLQAPAAGAPVVPPAQNDPTIHVVLSIALGAAGLGLIALDAVTLAMQGNCSMMGTSGCEQAWAIEPVSFGIYGGLGIASVIGSVVWLVVALSSGPRSGVAWNGQGLSFAWGL